ncbi:MAG TPA: fumarylacetoacetase [Actinomycetales bacterium]|nr:fumarylacetoacetase [Actinomycetales bacterium]
MSWVAESAGSLFDLHNLPYGVFSLGGGPRRVGVAIGTSVLDLTAACGTQRSPHTALFDAGTLDPLLAAGPATWRAQRGEMTGWLTDPAAADRLARHLVPRADVDLHLPFSVADYVDFYASEQHATNLGRLLRPGQQPLPAAWRNLPIGYHGRAGTVVISGSSVPRPRGQRWVGEPGSRVALTATERLDVEVEVGFVVGTPSPRGSSVPLQDLTDHVFGVVLVNDWSARDVQAFEYVPLGPFLGKSFATSVSPWVVPLAALEHARVRPPVRQPRPLPYLDDTDAEPWGLDLQLELRVNGCVLSRPPFAGMYWTPAQLLAHLTVNGASLRSGDLLASGTVSGPAPGEWGSLMELSWGGTRPVRMPDGSELTFLRDGDDVVISGTFPGPGGGRLGLGEVRGTVLPATG